MSLQLPSSSQRRSKTILNPDDPTGRFLYAILKQVDLKNIDWNEVAADLDITNGHAARMRYSRLKSQIEGTGPYGRRKDARGNVLNGSGKKKTGHGTDASWLKKRDVDGMPKQNIRNMPGNMMSDYDGDCTSDEANKRVKLEVRNDARYVPGSNGVDGRNESRIKTETVKREPTALSEAYNIDTSLLIKDEHQPGLRRGTVNNLPNNPPVVPQLNHPIKTGSVVLPTQSSRLLDIPVEPEQSDAMRSKHVQLSKTAQAEPSASLPLPPTPCPSTAVIEHRRRSRQQTMAQALTPRHGPTNWATDHRRQPPQYMPNHAQQHQAGPPPFVSNRPAYSTHNVPHPVAPRNAYSAYTQPYYPYSSAVPPQLGSYYGNYGSAVSHPQLQHPYAQIRGPVTGYFDPQAYHFGNVPGATMNRTASLKPPQLQGQVRGPVQPSLSLPRYTDLAAGSGDNKQFAPDPQVRKSETTLNTTDGYSSNRVPNIAAPALTTNKADDNVLSTSANPVSGNVGAGGRRPFGSTDYNMNLDLDLGGLWAAFAAGEPYLIPPANLDGAHNYGSSDNLELSNNVSTFTNGNDNDTDPQIIRTNANDNKATADIPHMGDVNGKVTSNLNKPSSISLHQSATNPGINTSIVSTNDNNTFTDSNKMTENKTHLNEEQRQQQAQSPDFTFTNLLHQDTHFDDPVALAEIINSISNPHVPIQTSTSTSTPTMAMNAGVNKDTKTDFEKM